jgi:protein-S-isoprenylcysteine O-methyltransferase Ste14
MMMLTTKLAILAVFTIGNLWVSRRILRDYRAHGFYRTFAWEAILFLVTLNLETWFRDPLAFHQIVSWPLLMVSIVLAFLGFRMLTKMGETGPDRIDPNLIGIEKTTELVTSGVFATIRHPLYSSLLFLTWGAFFKDPSVAGVSLAGVATFFLVMTAKIEEVENLAYFGKAYSAYMEKTKMFIPYVI